MSTGELRVYDGCGISVDGGEPLADGSMENPIHAVACNGEGDKRVFAAIAAGAIVEVWAWVTDADNWTAFRIKADGAFRISYEVDAPTSASDNTPLGTKVGWLTEVRSCFAPRWFESMVAPCNATPGNLVNAAFGGAGTTDGRIYKIRVKNTDTVPITVRTLRVP